MKEGYRKSKKRFLSFLLTAVMTLSILPWGAMEAQAAGETLKNPRVAPAPSMAESKQNVTWDCVWFGSYPQSEVQSSDPVYNMLQNESEWDDNGEATVNGSKYRRMKKGDATYTASANSYYSWSDDTTYHYFKYEPIKWRVLKTDGSKALLLSEMVLDDRQYNTAEEDVTWETSTVRSWLNGYDASKNQKEVDYSSKSFIGSAFSTGEEAAIASTYLVNAQNSYYETGGGNNTRDKVFFLSESDVYGDTAESYGFIPGYPCNDEARRCRSSEYAKAMGSYAATNEAYQGNSYWWLRSPGRFSNYAMKVKESGEVDSWGSAVSAGYSGVRTALNLELASNQWKYAGTVSSDKTQEPASSDVPNNSGNSGDTDNTGVNTNTGTNTGGKPEIKVSKIKISGVSQKIAAGKQIKLTAKVTPSNAKNKEVTWKSGNTKVATVNNKGVVTMKKGSGGKSVTITATAKDGSKVKGTYKLTSMKNAVKKVDISGKTSVKAGKTLKLTAKVTPSGSKKVNAKLTWTSSNTKYATVSSAGKVKAKKAGKGKKVKITAMTTDGSGKKKTVTIKIK